MILGCNHQKNQKDYGQLFTDNYKKLPLVSLPLTTQSFGDIRFSTRINEITDTTINKIFGHGWGYTIGRLSNNKNHFAVLSFFPDDVGTPLVTTYSESGTQLDSLWLFDDRPAATIGLISKQYVTITPEFLIQFTDSSFYLDTLDNIISSEVIQKTFYIDNSGKFKQQ